MNSFKNTLAAIGMAIIPTVGCAKSTPNPAAIECIQTEPTTRIINMRASLTFIAPGNDPSPTILTDEQRQDAIEFAKGITSLEVAILQQIAVIFRDDCHGDLWHFFVQTHAEKDQENHIIMKAKAMIEFRTKPSADVEKCMKEVVKEIRRSMHAKKIMRNLECVLSEDDVQKGNSEEDARLKPNLNYKPIGLDCEIN